MGTSYFKWHEDILNAFLVSVNQWELLIFIQKPLSPSSGPGQAHTALALDDGNPGRPQGLAPTSLPSN